jgi:hypothetical protein
MSLECFVTYVLGSFRIQEVSATLWENIERAEILYGPDSNHEKGHILA